MAVVLIDEPLDPKILKKVSCNRCASRLMYAPIDVKSQVVKDYGGGSDVYRWITCAGCQNDVSVT